MGYSLHDIGFSYEDRPIFEGVSIKLETGLFHGVLGPNGSGKTTLLDLLTGHHKPQQGSVLLEEHRLEKFSRREMARKCALVPQDFRVNFPFTVFQVVMMGRYPHVGRFGGPSQADLDLVEQAMDATGVRAFAHRYVTELSGGERQRVVFARALAQNAETLILDEATSNLDIRHTLSLMRLVAERVCQAGLTAIAVMQDINLAARFCQSLVFLKNGRVAAHGPVEEVLTEAVIREVFEVEARAYLDETINRRQVVFL
ncbi:MAG: ABC transporter ATP-binding protein [Desulfatibacillum sp.]|nr:ABC transporter ATP-binding protein [Desulfatibacillum sp.]